MPRNRATSLLFQPSIEEKAVLQIYCGMVDRSQTEVLREMIRGLKKKVNPDDLAVVVSALRQEAKTTWKIEGKNRVEDDWVTLTCPKNEARAIKRFEKIKAEFSGGFYQLVNPDGCVVDQHPEDLWSLPEKLERLDITSPSDWNAYNDYLLDGGKLEYEEWKASKDDDGVQLSVEV